IAPAHVARRLRRAVGLPEADGILVRGVEEDSPAAHAEIREGDLIVKAGERPIRDPDELHTVLDALASGATLKLTLLRGTEERQVTVAFG
ncbi:MAG: PDZ domain-containing protein, partial [Actinomycetota bacterium]